MLHEKSICTNIGNKDNVQSSADQSRVVLESCDFIKTVLMLVVVIYHGILFWRGTWYTRAPVFEASPLAWLVTWMNTFHIQGFTLVSGYVFFYVKHRAGRYRSYKSFLLNKAKRLLVPYAFVAAVWVIPFDFLFSETSIASIIKNYVFGISPSQLWFLLMLFEVFMIMWPLSDYLRKHTILGAALIAALNMTGLIGERVLPDYFQIWRACKFCLYFWMGMKLCQHIEEKDPNALKKFPARLFFLVDIALYAVTGLIPENGLFFKLLVKGLELLLKIIGALMAFVVLSKLSERVMWKENKLFQMFRKCSFAMYLFHQQLVYCGIELFDGKLNPYLHGMVNILIAIIGSFLISWLLMRFKVTRMMIGEKG